MCSGPGLIGASTNIVSCTLPLLNIRSCTLPKQLRQRQIEFGDRAVYFDEEGRKMSCLKEVDAEWVLRRLERWGKSDNMPFIGPKKVCGVCVNG